MKRVLLTIAAAFALVAAAMPTKNELRKAEPLVMELMKPLVESYNAKKKTATEVGDTAMTYAHKADTEAAKFLLFKGAVWYYAQDRADDKAVMASTELQKSVKSIPPEVIRNEILRPAVNKVSAQSVPGLFAQYRTASARVEIAKLEPSVRGGRADEVTHRRYAELLAIADDWKAALAAFTELKDAKTGQIAQNELAGKALSAAGDFWWDYKPTEDMATDSIKAHAATLYLKAIASGELTGLKKVIAEKRIEEVGPRGIGTLAASANTNLLVATSARPHPLVLDLGGSVKMEMVGCPSGKFLMTGCSDLEKGGHTHTVEITRPFWIGKYPVTIKQWEQSMSKVDPLPGVKPRDMDPNLPVQIMKDVSMGGMSRATIDEFAARLTQKFKNRLPTGYVFRLPTEAEWEYSLKADWQVDLQELSNISYGGSHHRISQRAQIAAESFVVYEDSESYWLPRGCDPKLFNEEFHMAPYIPVGQRKPNAWGIYDMGGCALECFLDSAKSAGRTPPEERRRWYESHRQHFVNGVKDPLLFEVDDLSKTRLFCRYGFSTAKGNNSPFTAGGRFSMEYELRGTWFPVIKLRLVVGPDLLKERGLTPPKLDK